MIRIGLIGFGGMGQLYARMLYAGMAPGLHLAGVCCRNAPGQALLAKEFPGVAVYADSEEMTQRCNEFDAVLIVTPHTSHITLGKQMAALGKDIFMDKPAGIFADEVAELLRLCKENNVSFAMMFNNRLLPAYQKAKQLLTEDALGTLHRAVWVCNDWYRSPAYHRSASWRSSWAGECGGMLVNQTPHNLDLWNWLLGLPQSVDAALQFGRYNNFTVDDGADIRFFYDNGLRGNFIAATGEAPGVNRLEIWGSKGKLTIENGQRLYIDENVISTEEFGATNTEKFAAIPHARREIELESLANPYPGMLQNFADHLLKGTPLIATGEDGLRQVQLTNAVYVSGWQERRVTLPVAADDFRKGLAACQNRERGE